MSELKYTATQMNNVLSSSQEYYRNWKEAEKINKELRARISELSQAVGLITTLKPTMVMDTEHPLDMAKEVAEYVTVRIAELERLVDELVNIGDNLFDSLNPIAWKHEWLDKWWKLSSCRRGERE